MEHNNPTFASIISGVNVPKQRFQVKDSKLKIPTRMTDITKGGKRKNSSQTQLSRNSHANPIGGFGAFSGNLPKNLFEHSIIVLLAMGCKAEHDHCGPGRR
jgi:hypothetical protein